MKRLPQAWFARDAPDVARSLIGCALVHRKRAGIIVETEAYLGEQDRASHARFGATARTSVMFGPAGRSYVYLIYGIHEMFNIVTGADGDGQAVLIRAIAPLAGLGDELSIEPHSHPGVLPVAHGSQPSIGRGPGKVTRALGIDRRHDRRDLATGSLYVAAYATPPRIGVGPRIGVAYAGAWARRRLRFWWHGHASVSAT